MTLIDQKRLKELLNYNPVTGVFTWRAPTSNRVRAGDEAGTINPKGYRIITLDGRLYRAHRLAWLYAYNSWPPMDLDHYDRNKLNNALTNLRPATNQQNHANRGKNKNNVLGIKGVTIAKGKFRAQITINGKNRHLGYFPTPALAVEAYEKVAKSAFGEFAST